MATAATPGDPDHLGPVALARRGAAAALVALVVNLLVVSGAAVAEVAPGFDPLSYASVATATLFGVAGATLVYGVLDRFVANADRVFAVAAAVALLVSFVPDATVAASVPGATTAGLATLAAMHVTTAAVCVAFLTDSWDQY